MKYRRIEHTADIGMAIEGETIAELFVNGAEALFDCMIETESVSQIEARTISLSAENATDLFRDWLAELLYLFSAEGLVLAAVSSIEVGENHLEARISGEIIDPARHRLKTELKAVTYHQLSVRRESDTWKATVIFDV